MKVKYLFCALAFASAFMGLTACGDDDEPQPDSPAEEAKAQPGVIAGDDGSYTLYRKTNYGDDWIYVSLSTMDTVAVSEENHKESLDWDIAFNRYNVRTNSGTSGNGKGGVYKTSATKFADVKDFPAADEFTVDTEWEITKTPTMSADGVITMTSSANPILSEAITIIIRNGPPDYNISENVYLVRSADGSKIYKFKTVSFFNAKGNSGYYNFMVE